MWPLITFWCIRIVSMTFLGGNTKKHENYELRQAENSFSAIFPKISILRYMLIYKLYINVAIIGTFWCIEIVSTTLLGRNTKIRVTAKTLEKGVAENALIAKSSKMQ